MEDVAVGSSSIPGRYAPVTPDPWAHLGVEPTTASMPQLHDLTSTTEYTHEQMNGEGMAPLDMILTDNTDFLKTAFAQSESDDAPTLPLADASQGAIDWLDPFWPLGHESGQSTPAVSAVSAVSAETDHAPRRSSSPSSSRLWGQSDVDRDVTSDAGFRLCRFALSLSEQLFSFKIRPWEDALAATTGRGGIPDSPGRSPQSEQPDQPEVLGEVLRSTSEFISILQEFNLAIAPTAGARCGPRPRRTSFPPPSRGSPTESATPVSSCITSVSSATRVPGTCAASITDAAPELSIATALSLLSSHLHLMAIYNALFRHLHASLSRIPAVSISALQVVPGLRLAGFPVHHGGLQIKMLIQVIEHYIETIDGALGLPAKYCLRGGGVRTLRASDYGGGLLEGREFEALLDAVMGGSGAGPALGPGLRTILALRQSIDDVEQYLR